MDTFTSWMTSARDWLDARGRPAWIAAMILGFIFAWPVGLGLLFYMIGSKRMNCNWKRRRMANYNQVANYKNGTTGNSAFDLYRDETLRRLEEEQTAFQSFLTRLRDAKDKAEFDQFMNERRSTPAPTPTPPGMTPEFG